MAQAEALKSLLVLSLFIDNGQPFHCEAFRLGVVAWVSVIQRFRRRCLDLDGNTKLKSKAGQYGNDSSIVSNVVQFADRSFHAEKVNERHQLITAGKVYARLGSGFYRRQCSAG